MLLLCLQRTATSPPILNLQAKGIKEFHTALYRKLCGKAAPCYKNDTNVLRGKWGKSLSPKGVTGMLVLLPRTSHFAPCYSAYNYIKIAPSFLFYDSCSYSHPGVNQKVLQSNQSRFDDMLIWLHPRQLTGLISVFTFSR